MNETTLSDTLTINDAMDWSIAFIFSTSIKCLPADTPLNWDPLEPVQIVKNTYNCYHVLVSRTNKQQDHCHQVYI